MEEVPSLWAAVSFFQGPEGGPGAAQSPRSWATEKCAVFYVLGLCLPLVSFLSFQNCSSLTVARTPCLRLFRASAVADRQSPEGYVFLSRLSSLTHSQPGSPRHCAGCALRLRWVCGTSSRALCSAGSAGRAAGLSALLGLRDEQQGSPLRWVCGTSSRGSPWPLGAIAPPPPPPRHQQASCPAGSSGASPHRAPTGGTASLGLLVTSQQAWPLRSRVWGKNHPHAASGGKRLYCFPLSCSPSLKTKV